LIVIFLRIFRPGCRRTEAMHKITDAVEAVFGVILLVLAPLVLVTFFNHAKAVMLLAGW
jgi:hypothetical protein